jgi:hypothetical protein
MKEYINNESMNKPVKPIRVETTIIIAMPGHCQMAQLTISEAKELMNAIGKELKNLKGEQK